MRKYVLTQLDSIINETNDKELLEKIRKRVLDLTEPTDYQEYSKKSTKGFEELCLMLTEQFHKDVKTLNVMEFESAQSIMANRAKEYDKRKK